MRLYQIRARFIRDDSVQDSILGFLFGNSDEEIYKFISKHYAWGEPSWEEQYERGTKERIMERRGDFDEEYMGDNYDQKFAWTDLGTPSEAEITILKKFQIPFLE